MKKRAIVAVIVLLLIGLDQLVKSYIVQQIPLGEVRSWIPNFVSLTYLQNRGAAFSILQDQQLLFAVITLVVVIGAIWYLHKHMEDSFWMVLGLTLIIAGGLGNLLTGPVRALLWICSTLTLSTLQFSMWQIAI